MMMDGEGNMPNLFWELFACTAAALLGSVVVVSGILVLAHVL